MKNRKYLAILVIAVSSLYLSCSKSDSFVLTSDQVFSISENFPSDSIFGTIIITEQNMEDEDVVSYIIGGDPDTIFGIIPGTGELFVNKSEFIDYEQNTLFEFVVETKYANMLGYSASKIQVNIEDIQPTSSNIMTYINFDGNTLNNSDTIHGIPTSESYNTSFGNKYLAQSFNGNDSYTDLSSNFDTANFSVNFWFYCDPDILSTGFLFSLDNPDLNYGKKAMSISIADSETILNFEANDFKDTTIIQTGTWYMATMTVSSSFFKYYLNGEFIGQKAISDSFSSEDGYQNALIGCSSIFDGYFQGLIDDLRIYAKALTKDEISVLLIE